MVATPNCAGKSFTCDFLFSCDCNHCTIFITLHTKLSGWRSVEFRIIYPIEYSICFINLKTDNTNSGQAEPLRNSRSTAVPRDYLPVRSENSSNIRPVKEQPKCETFGCIKASSRVISYIDESVDPCDNFYEFACGNYIRSTQIPEDKVIVDSFSTVDDLVRDQLRTIINEPPQPNESKPFRLAKNFNSACLNQTIIEDRGIKPLADVLESYGGWPVVKGDLWSDAAFDWTEFVKKFRRMGLETRVIFSLSVVTDLKNSTKRVLDVSKRISSFWEFPHQLRITSFS